MLQPPESGDYVVATGKSHSVREFVELAFDYVGLDWRNHVEIDPSLRRPAEVYSLLGDPSKAHQRLGWRAQTSLAELVREMVEADLRLFSPGAAELSGVEVEA